MNEIEDGAHGPLVPRGLSWSFAFGVALAGGVLGTAGAFVQEAMHFPLLALFVAAPIIEEAFKPVGVYFLVAKYPRSLRNQKYTAVLLALGGLSFGLVESTVYVTFYFPDEGSGFVLFRYTVPVAIHMITSFIAGFGTNQRLIASARGEVPFLSRNWKFFAVAMVVHALYNVGAVAYSWTSD